MFEKYLQQRKDEILTKIDFDAPNIYIRDLIANPGIAKPYKAYFDAESDWWIYEERVLRKTHPNFRLDDEESRSVLTELEQVLRKKARAAKSEIGYLAADAVKARMNYLVRPRTTLKWFIFRGEPTRPFVEIIKRLNYFYDYKYFYDGILKWAEERHIDRNSAELMSIDEFTRLIDRIDNNRTYDLSVDEFADLLKPMFEFFDEKNDEGDAQIPIEALIIFLDDKGINPLARSLESMRSEGKKFLTRDEIIEFYNSMLEKYEHGVPEEPASAEAPPEISDDMPAAADFTADEPQPQPMPESIEDISAPDTSEPEDIEKEEVAPEPAPESKEEATADEIEDKDWDLMEAMADFTADEPQPQPMPEAKKSVDTEEDRNEDWNLMEAIADFTADEPQPMPAAGAGEVEPPREVSESEEVDESAPEEITEDESEQIIPETDEDEMTQAADFTADEPQPQPMPEAKDEISAPETSAPEDIEKDEVTSGSASEPEDGAEDFDELINKIENLPESESPEPAQALDDELMSEFDKVTSELENLTKSQKKNAESEIASGEAGSDEISDMIAEIDELFDKNEEDMPEIEESRPAETNPPETPAQPDKELDENFLDELKELFGDQPEEVLRSQNVDQYTRQFQESFLSMLQFDKNDKILFSDADFPADVLDMEIIDPENRDWEDNDNNDDIQEI